MAKLIYIDETGSVGKGAKKQPLLTVVGAVVDESKVRPLAEAFRKIARKHLGYVPADFELHGNEIWNGTGYWKGKSPVELLSVYSDAIQVLKDLDIGIAHASIRKERLNSRYNGEFDTNAYLLALQFLLEKLDRYSMDNKIVIADEQKEHELRAVSMVADLQDWGNGPVPGRKLETIIDSIHFVNSRLSPGVQMADIVAYALQRKWNSWDKHPNARAALSDMVDIVDQHVLTWRVPWP
ncbi:DUF3800 domain-containing protein [Kineococcus sp. G2]|uniref:DUF3800 domain-containing protein n=1 Tax=Kineococcus sp. G2 TaxID=3127484 RepID=UPI00301B9FB4